MGNDNTLAARLQAWRQFCDAADDAARGRYDKARLLVASHPVVRGELRAFVAALKEGRIRQTGAYQYENVWKKGAKGSKS
jgi:hypothetical protein